MVKMETTCSQQNRRMLLGLRALRHCLLSADHQLKLWQHAENNLRTQNRRSGQCWRLGLALAVHISETDFQACAQHIRAVAQRQVCKVGLHKLSDHSTAPERKTWRGCLQGL